MSNYEVYEFKRGTTWSVKCVVNDYYNITYTSVVVPEGTSSELKNKFIEEAEVAVLKQVDKAWESRYAHD